MDGTVAKYQPVLGTWELLAPSHVIMIENSAEHLAQFDKPALTLFHNLVITNISEFIPEQQFTELWAAIEGNQAVLDNHVNPHGQRREFISVRASKTIRLQANSETFVPCVVESPETRKDLVLVSQSTKIFKNDPIVAPAVISTHHPLLLICNPTNEHKTIFAGTKISTAIPVDEHDINSGKQNSVFSCVNEIPSDDPSYVINLDESDVDDKQRERPAELLDTFSDVFSRHQYDIGSCTAGKVHIFTTNEPPARIRPYRIPIKYREELQKHINMLLKTGVMKESNTNWVHNLMVVQKKDNSLRVCLDMRRPINEVT
ncbi:hypothetical protein Aduo_015739 [Ancylostoma duodenale]